jgi:mono/diheme cytochrome c family protein
MVLRILVPLFLYLAALLPAADTREQFEMQVRPLLAKNCFACHQQSAMGGLRLDSRETILKGGKSGPAAVAGEPEKSLLIGAVSHTLDRLKMPPGGKLSSDDVAILSAWIKGGLYWPPDDKAAKAAASGEYVITPEQRAFWSFQPVKAPAPPAVKNTSWPKNEIDRFVLARLEREGLHPVATADRRTLLRRATLDLTGLPPTPEEADAFLRDKSPDAFAKVVDRLLASPRYGERWGRYWLDVARYSDDSLNSTKDEPYPNSFRYRNWVISAFNEDMPYDTFVKAQLAGDQMGDKYAAGTGFYALSPEFQDDRVDATSRGFLGLTVACATCHNHKFDPIPTKDFYSLQGVFSSTDLNELPLASKDVVDSWTAKKKLVDHQETLIEKFYDNQRDQLAEILASRTAQYMLATRNLASAAELDAESLQRMTAYLSEAKKDHPYLKPWFALVESKASDEEFRRAAADFQKLLLAVAEEKKEVDHKNELTLGLNPNREDVAGASLVSLSRDKYIVWRDMFERSVRDSAGFFKTSEGIFHYNKSSIERFLQGHWKSYLETQKAELERLKKELPEKYPFLQSIKDKDKPEDVHIAIRGDANNKGDLAPRRFLAILSSGERKPFSKGSGRMELAEAIADPKNPLTARVFVNRVWQRHFGRGIVGTPSNFGQLGERPTHPELLDYLADSFVKNGWSIKKLHREMMLSATYQLSPAGDSVNENKDAPNTLLWRYNRHRLDVEALRDSVLFVSGKLETKIEDLAKPLDEKNTARTVYGFVSRRRLDGTLALFDFPNPNSTSEGRIITNVPLQRLYWMNSKFIEEQARALAERLHGDNAARIREAYRLLLARDPDAEELKMGLEYVPKASWPSYARALLSSNEFEFVD